MIDASEIKLDFAKMGGLLPAIVQDNASKEVLMLGFMNEAAWEKTLRTGMVTFWSRQRQTLWTKGETSGHHLAVRSIWVDCDEDTLLIQATANGPICHTGERTCFYREVSRA